MLWGSDPFPGAPGAPRKEAAENMRKSLLFLVLLGGLAWPSQAADHLVTDQARAERLDAAAAQRQDDLATLHAVLVSPAASRTVARLGVSPERVQAGVATLSDAELRDLAARAQSLQGDPAAAIDADIKDLLVIFLIVAIVILVLQAVD